MTTTVTFNPQSDQVFQFQATLDGGSYNCYCLWNVVRSGYWILIQDNSGNTILYQALTSGAPDGVAGINILFGFFTTSTMVFRASTQQFEITP